MKLHILIPIVVLTGCATTEPEGMATANGANFIQRPAYDHLKAGTRAHLPKGYDTIKQAGDFILAPAGYTVVGQMHVTAAPRGKISQGTLQTIEAAMLAIGNGRQMIVDDKERTVTFAPADKRGPTIIRSTRQEPPAIQSQAPITKPEAKASVSSNDNFGTF